MQVEIFFVAFIKKPKYILLKIMSMYTIFHYNRLKKTLQQVLFHYINLSVNYCIPEIKIK